MLKKLLREEKGSAVILIALGMTAFLGFTALVTDVGLLYWTDYRLTNAVDAAVLAGAQELPYNPTDALAIAINYAESNGISADDINIEIFNNNRSIRVIGQRDVTFLFGKALGKSSGKVNHIATAQVAPIVGVNGAAPLGIEKHDFVFGEQYTLKIGAGDKSNKKNNDDGLEGISPGWFGALALGGNGASQYEDNLTYGYQGALKIGDIVDIKTGNMSGPTKRAVDYRIAGCKHVPYCTADNFHRDSTRLIKVPVIEVVGQKSVKITGFAMFLLDDVTGNGNESYVKGKFVKTITSGEVSSEAEDYGLVGVRLVE